LGASQPTSPKFNVWVQDQVHQPAGLLQRIQPAPTAEKAKCRNPRVGISTKSQRVATAHAILRDQERFLHGKPPNRARMLNSIMNIESFPGAAGPISIPATRVLLVDDHGIVREGVATLLELDQSIKVVGCAATGEDAIQATGRLKPDVVVMDVLLPGLNGIEATALIVAQSPRTLVIVLSSSKTPGHVQRALQAGARGYVLKSAESVDLVHVIKAAIAGGRYISPAITELAGMSKLLGAQESPLDFLSSRERDVLRRVVAGYTSADIGRQLSLSLKTIETYRGRLMLKLGVNDRAGLICLAMTFEVPPG